MLVSTVVEFMIKTGKTFIHQNSWQPWALEDEVGDQCEDAVLCDSEEGFNLQTSHS